MSGSPTFRPSAWVLIGALVASIFFSSILAIQEAQPQRQRIDAQQQANGAIESEQDRSGNHRNSGEVLTAAASQEPIASTDHGEGSAQHTEQQATEYWPEFWGLRLKITDSLLALFTLFLVLIGIFHAFVFLRTDNATRMNAEALKALERGRFIVNEIKLFGVQGTIGFEAAHRDKLEEMEMIPVLQVVNVGRTVITLSEVCVQWLVAEKLPESPVYLDGRPWRTSYLPLGNDIQKGFQALRLPQFKRVLRDAEANILQKGSKNRLWIYGYIDYRDSAEEMWRHRFGAWWNSESPPNQPHAMLGFDNSEMPTAYEAETRLKQKKQRA